MYFYCVHLFVLKCFVSTWNHCNFTKTFEVFVQNWFYAQIFHLSMYIVVITQTSKIKFFRKKTKLSILDIIWGKTNRQRIRQRYYMTDRVQVISLPIYDFEDFWNVFVEKLVTFQSPISIVTNYDIKKKISECLDLDTKCYQNALNSIQ